MSSRYFSYIHPPTHTTHSLTFTYNGTLYLIYRAGKSLSHFAVSHWRGCWGRAIPGRYIRLDGKAPSLLQNGCACLPLVNAVLTNSSARYQRRSCSIPERARESQV